MYSNTNCLLHGCANWMTDELASMYNPIIKDVLECLILSYSVVHPPVLPLQGLTVSAELAAVKSYTCKLEHAYSAAYHCATFAASDSSAASAVDSTKPAWYAQRRSYRDLRHRKCSNFWATMIEADQANPRKLWQSVNKLLGRGRVPPSDAIDVGSFSHYFTEKTDKVRQMTQTPHHQFTLKLNRTILSRR